jgi:multiple sugar transport system permease protein
MANRPLKRLIAYATLLLGSALFIAPFAWMVSTSLKHESYIFSRPGEPPQWIPKTARLDSEGRTLVTYKGETVVSLGPTEAGMARVLLAEDSAGVDTASSDKVIEVWPEEIVTELRFGLHWPNYVEAFKTIDFLRSLQNTLFICVTVVLGTLISCSLVAYSFSRIEWPGRDVCFIIVLATMMMPYQVMLIPLFVLFKTLGWTGTFKPLVLPAFLGTPFYIFLLRQFFMGIPRDLSAAARIDGCNEFGIYWRIILPLAKPALATTALFMFLFQWGDFLNPLIYLQDDRQYTLALALQNFQSQHESAWGPLMAMSTVIMLPVIALFFLTQRTFIQGITLTGLKG